MNTLEKLHEFRLGRNAGRRSELAWASPVWLLVASSSLVALASNILGWTWLVGLATGTSLGAAALAYAKASRSIHELFDESCFLLGEQARRPNNKEDRS